MKKIFNQDNLKSLQGQLGSFSATVKWPNMPSLTAATTPASAPSTSEPPSQLLSRQASITGELCMARCLTRRLLKTSTIELIRRGQP